MKKWIVVVATVLGLALAAPAMAAEKIMIGVPTWVGARLMGALIKQIIIDKLGVEADTTPGNNVVIFKSMDRGKGDIDVHPDVWRPNQESLVNTYVNEHKTVALSDGFYEGTVSWCVSTKVAKRLQIKTVFDLATPEMAKHFDVTGDDRGEIWIGPGAWASTNNWRVKLRDYGLGNFFDPTTEEEAIAYASLGDAIRKDKPFIVLCYTPHYVFKLYDLTRIEEPPHDPAKYTIVQPNEDADWYNKSKILTGEQVRNIHVAYSLSLEKRAPRVAKFLKNITMDADTMSTWTHQVVVDEREPADLVREWIASNSARVDGWLGL